MTGVGNHPQTKEFFLRQLKEHSSAQECVFSDASLPSSQLGSLSEKLLHLPEDAQYLFFGYYCFHLTISAIEELFAIEEGAPHFDWYKSMLSRAAGLEQGQRLDDASYLLISQNALALYVERAEKEASAGKVVHMSIKTRYYVKRTLRFIAAAFIILLLGSTITISSNANIRQAVFAWLTKTYESFSVFMARTKTPVSLEDMLTFSPHYVPDNYEFMETITDDESQSYLYHNSDDELLVIVISLPDKEYALDTEDMEKEVSDYSGTEAIYYHKSDWSTFAFSKEGYAMYVLGNVEKDEMLRIADGIKK